ncbi:MAG: hypothetical protein COB76_07150 [Alphaproteobacteria bacterium]|nr:MAG: hypothetical protein COB76_07150 [Alphaproteobacteria bacterium]
MSKKSNKGVVSEFFEAVLGPDREDGGRWFVFKICVASLLIAGTLKACKDLEREKSSADANITIGQETLKLSKPKADAPKFTIG